MLALAPTQTLFPLRHSPVDGVNVVNGGKPIENTAQVFLDLFAALVSPAENDELRPTGQLSFSVATASGAFPVADQDDLSESDEEPQSEIVPTDVDSPPPFASLFSPCPPPVDLEQTCDPESTEEIEPQRETAVENQSCATAQQSPVVTQPDAPTRPVSPDLPASLTADLSKTASTASASLPAEPPRTSPPDPVVDSGRSGRNTSEHPRSVEPATAHAFGLVIRRASPEPPAESLVLQDIPRNTSKNSERVMPTTGDVPKPNVEVPASAGTTADQSGDRQPPPDPRPGNSREEKEDRAPEVSDRAQRETTEPRPNQTPVNTPPAHITGDRNIVQLPEPSRFAEALVPAPPPARAEFRAIEELRFSGIPLPRSGTIQDIEIRLPSPGNPVDVRLSDKNGQLEISVRTGNEQLASDLRGKLPELLQSLESGGYEAAPEPQPIDRGIAMPSQTNHRPFEGDTGHESAKRHNHQPGQQRKDKNSRNGRIFATHLELGSIPGGNQ